MPMGKIFRAPRKSNRKGKGFEKAVKRVISKSLETKVSESSLTDTSFVNNESGLILTDLCSINQGDTNQERDGNKIMLKGLSLILHIQNKLTSSASLLDTAVRLVVFYLPSDGHQTSGDWFALYGDNSFGITNFHLRDSNVPYKVLLDKTFTVGPRDGGGSEKVIKKYIKINKQVAYDGATGSTDLVRGNVVVGLYTTNVVANCIDFTILTRMFWKEE